MCIHKLAELFESNTSESFKRAVSFAHTAEGSIAMETSLGELQNPLQTQRDWFRTLMLLFAAFKILNTTSIEMRLREVDLLVKSIVRLLV